VGACYPHSHIHIARATLCWSCLWRPAASNRAAPVTSESQNDLKDFGRLKTNAGFADESLLSGIDPTVFGFHSYWVSGADSSKDSQFNKQGG